MIRNFKGCYVLIGNSPPVAVLLSIGQDKLYSDRCSVSGMAKANTCTFGADVASAVPCSAEAMEFIALNYQGLHADAVKAMCARIALGLPIGGDTDSSGLDGGTRIPRVQGPKGKGPGTKLAIPDAVTVQS